VVDDPNTVQIEFPCAYPIKVMGLDENDFAASVIAIVRRHDPDLDPQTITYRPSRNGKYLAVNLTITATGPVQIKALFEDLKASGRVAMVL
jgi:uncharacterized protein